MDINALLNQYQQIEDYVHNYCDEHNFSEEDRANAEQYIIIPAQKAVLSILIDGYFSPYMNRLLEASNHLFSTQVIRKITHKIAIQ